MNCDKKIELKSCKIKINNIKLKKKERSDCYGKQHKKKSIRIKKGKRF